MALIAFASGRSPGLTTGILALAATWPPPRRAVVSELDPDGGTIAARQVLPSDPGLISLAAAGSHGLSREAVTSSIQKLANGTLALLAPPGPDRVTASLDALVSSGLVGTLAGLPGLDVLADCGRIDRRSPALPFLLAADVIAFVVRSDVEDVVALQHRLQTLALGRRACGIVVVGRRPYRPEEVGRALQMSVLGILDHDRGAARTLGEGGRPQRSKLWRSAQVVSEALSATLPALATVGDNEAVPPPIPSARPPDLPGPGHAAIPLTRSDYQVPGCRP